MAPRRIRPTKVVEATVEGVGKGANLVYGTVVGDSRVPLTLALIAAIALQRLLPGSISLVLITSLGCYRRCSRRCWSR